MGLGETTVQEKGGEEQNKERRIRKIFNNKTHAEKCDEAVQIVRFNQSLITNIHTNTNTDAV